MSEQQTFTERQRARGLGIKCPACDHGQSSVQDSRLAVNSIRRRRQCEICGFRWTTYESTDRAGIDKVNLDFIIQHTERFLDMVKAAKGDRGGK